MAEYEKLNEEAALNNNLDALTLKTNEKIKAQHRKPRTKSNSNKK